MTAKRRSKGSGSIYVLKDGTVVGRYEVETPSGETKRKYVRGKTKREVAAKLAKAIAERDAGIVYDSEGLTVERYLVEHWLESIRDKVRPRSEEHTSELQSRQYLVCRLLLEKKKNHI